MPWSESGDSSKGFQQKGKGAADHGFPVGCRLLVKCSELWQYHCQQGFVVTVQQVTVSPARHWGVVLKQVAHPLDDGGNLHNLQSVSPLVTELQIHPHSFLQLGVVDKDAIGVLVQYKLQRLFPRFG